MSERKIVVPEGMVKAAVEGFFDKCGPALLPLGTIPTVLEAALRWLGENPILPTDEQLFDVSGNLGVTMAQIVWSERDRALIAEWQRRMFLAPVPEVPEEIANLLWGDWHKNARPDLVEPRTGFAPFESHNAQVLEAYRRGLRGSLKDKWEEFCKESKEKP